MGRFRSAQPQFPIAIGRPVLLEFSGFVLPFCVPACQGMAQFPCDSQRSKGRSGQREFPAKPIADRGAHFSPAWPRRSHSVQGKGRSRLPDAPPDAGGIPILAVLRLSIDEAERRILNKCVGVMTSQHLWDAVCRVLEDSAPRAHIVGTGHPPRVPRRSHFQVLALPAAPPFLRRAGRSQLQSCDGSCEGQRSGLWQFSARPIEQPRDWRRLGRQLLEDARRGGRNWPWHTK
jgi:hypothetical protein